MKLHGRSIIGAELGVEGGEGFRAFDPSAGQHLDPVFYQATGSDVERTFALAEQSFAVYRLKSAAEIAGFLEAISEQIVALGDDLITRAAAETGLSTQRLIGERGRTVGQLRMFAEVVREGSWLEAVIDRAQPDRQPVPRPDLRRMLIPIGPVVVFGASNFPLAFSVAGGDTASALAAGNPVIVKAHPAHPGTSELVGAAITRAAEVTEMPAGVFSLLQGKTPALSLSLVEHPATAAVGFTGSLQVGRAIHDAAARRPNPIPVYAEMGSINPVFVLPGALVEKGESLAAGLHQSVMLGVGQFCTCPGVIVGLRESSLDQLVNRLEELIAGTPPGTLLHPGIKGTFEDRLRQLSEIPGVSVMRSAGSVAESRTRVQATVLKVDAQVFLDHARLSEEVFGPATAVVCCLSKEEMLTIARNLSGELTATIHGTAEDLEEFKDLLRILERKVGRLIYNGFPTGVEVTAAMHHGGPYPATTDSRSTSVGAAAIKRFARPICFQNFPQRALPLELRDLNERGIWRMVDSQLTRNDVT